MELEKQVCSLHLSQRLKQLGVKQKSFWGWYRSREHYVQTELQPAGEPVLAENGPGPVDYPNELLGAAFTVSELGELLPWHGNLHVNVSTSFAMPEEFVAWLYLDNSPHVEKIYAHTEADARAKALVYLIDHDLLT